MSIRLAEANRAIEAALAKAHDLAVKISVAICDADGRPVAEAHRASYGKALVAATSGRPSGDESIEFSEDFKDFRTATVMGEAVPFIRRPGGLPIIRAGQVEGALGVAGATDEQDVECALAGIDAFTSSG